jgi:hypothetical protein
MRQSRDESLTLDGEQQRRAWLGPLRELCVGESWHDCHSTSQSWEAHFWREDGLEVASARTFSLQRRGPQGLPGYFAGGKTEQKEGKRDFTLGSQHIYSVSF